MDIRGKRLVVIGGAGLIGSHTVDLLTREDVGQIIVYDNFSRGTPENLEQALKDPRVEIFDVGGDICQPDILDAALKGAQGVFQTLGFPSECRGNILTCSSLVFITRSSVWFIPPRHRYTAMR